MIFNSAKFRAHLAAMEQEIYFSTSLGAHHQNGVAKRAVHTVTKCARIMLQHAILHWPDDVNFDLCPFTMDQEVYQWNHMPNQYTGISPMELIYTTS
jgi:hypothetical protein